MAKSWADLSKEERAATGMTKKEYNRSTGYRAEVLANENAPAPAPAPTPTPTPAPTPTPTPTPTPSRQEQIDNNQDVEERAKSTPSQSSSLFASARDEPITGPTFEPASSNDEPARSAAVNKTKSWADLSKDERAETGMTKKEYNQSTGYRAEVLSQEQENNNLDDESAFDLRKTNFGIGDTPAYTPPIPFAQKTTWADLSKDERAKTGMTKKEFNRQGYGGNIDLPPGTSTTMEFIDSDGDGVDDRNQLRPGGKNKVNPYANPDHMAQNQAQQEFRGIRNAAYEGTVKGSGERKGWRDDLNAEDANRVAQLENTIYGVDNIEDYNFAMGGTGSVKGKEAISKADLKGLQGAGFSDQEIIDHVNREMEGDAYIKGPKAQRFLDKMIAGLQTSDPVDPIDTIDPIGTIDPIEQIGGGNDSGIGNEIGGGDNTGGGNTIGGGDTGVGNGGNTGGGNGVDAGDNLDINDSFNETIEQIQDVDITQGNDQNFNVNQDNDMNVAITGDNNVSDIQQDNSVVNQGGDQSNNATVTGSTASTSSSNFLQNYLSGMGVFDTLRDAGIDMSGTLSSTGGNLSSTGTTTYTPDYPLMNTGTNPGSNTSISDSYNQDTYQTQDVDATQDNNQNFNVTQDNDLNAQITGDNNVSQITQDNSVRNYGGNQNNFTYVSGQNANGTPSYLTDSPVSAATMAGYYSPNDSPASNAAFVDRYQTMNSDAQKKYNPFGTAEGYMTRATNMPGTVDPTALRQEINMAPELAYARSDMANLNTYGDQYRAPSVRWNSALGRFEPIEPYDPAKAAEEAQSFFN